ncbi:MAG: type II secretion system F family protein [Acetobacter papayae]|uniref:type II secretion system F family protein n=1 Tax=Acetobacter papayae TaxID=1076592 RepID=UPI0039EBA6EB
MMAMLLFLSVLVLGFGCIWGVVLRPRLASGRRRARLDRLQHYRVAEVVDRPGRRFSLVRGAYEIGSFMMRHKVLPRRTIDELFRTLARNTQEPDRLLPVFIGAKTVLFGVGLLLGFVVFVVVDIGSIIHLVLPAGLPIGGMLLPDMVLAARRRHYLRAVESGMADALDMLTICVDAGMPIEAAMQRVARDMLRVNGSVASELQLTARDMSLMPDRQEALRQMATRTGLPVMRQVATVLGQSFEVGSPIAQDLRLLSEDVQADTMLRYQTSAARLPVYLTLPMILFILPVIFIVVIGPVALSLLGQ